MHYLRQLTALLLLILVWNSAAANDPGDDLGDDLDDVLGGFDNDFLLDNVEAQADADEAADSQTILGWEPSGSLAASASWNLRDHQSTSGTNYSGLSKLRFRANLELERNFKTLNLGFAEIGQDWQLLIVGYSWFDASYDLHDRNYSNEVLDEYRFDLDVANAWLQGRLSDSWDVKIGRQVVVWGYSDNLRVLDQLNPLDNLEPGIADIEDLRRPIGMFAFDHYREISQQRWKFSFIVAPENRFSRNPPFGSDFYAITDEQGNTQRLEQEKPDDFERVSWAVAAFGQLFGLDTQLIATRRWRDEPYLDTSRVDRNNFPAALATFNERSRLAYSRIATVGFGLQKNIGSWLFKQEANYLTGGHVNSVEIVDIANAGPTAISNDVTADRYDLLLGLEYFGLPATSIALDISGRWLSDFNADLERAGQQRQRNELALRITRDFLNERLRVTAFALFLSDSGKLLSDRGGSISRLSAEYEWLENVDISGGIIVYGSGNQPPFNIADDNDRLFAQIKYRF